MEIIGGTAIEINRGNIFFVPMGFAEISIIIPFLYTLIQIIRKLAIIKKAIYLSVLKSETGKYIAFASKHRIPYSFKFCQLFIIIFSIELINFFLDNIEFIIIEIRIIANYNFQNDFRCKESFRLWNSI